MSTSIERIHVAIEALKNGKMVILVDHPDRENEGDLIAPAETITAEQMNFMIRHGGGIVCLPLTPHRLQELNLPLMVPPEHNTSCYGTPFTISIDARAGITTGVSAQDRIKTIQTTIRTSTKPDDLVRPGHVFPLQAKAGGVLERQGHTEGSIDLVTLAGFKAAAVLSEVMNEDGTMAKGNQLEIFAKTHHLPIVTIDDIITYRLQQEELVEESATAIIPFEQYGIFKMTVVREKINNMEHIILINETIQSTEPPLVRIHSACMTGDLFASTRCDCHRQFHYALRRISEEGGMMIYLNQEGRGIGLLNKIKAYGLQEQGCDTVEANQKLGLPVDSRQYYLAAYILRKQNMQHIRLLTNNPAKISGLKQYGIQHINPVQMPTFCTKQNHRYLEAKQKKLNHTITMPFEEVGK